MLDRSRLARLLSLKVQRALQKYEAKTRPARVRAVLDNVQPEMGRRLAAAMNEMALVESTVRTVCTQAGAPACTLPFLLSYGRYVYGRWRRLKGSALTRELAVTAGLWELRGLDPLLLSRVREQVIAALAGLHPVV